MIKAKKLNKGDTVGVISPASASFHRSDVLRAQEMLESMGFNVLLGDHVNETKGFFSASEENRIEDFNNMFYNDRVDAVFVTQGGYGSAQILGDIDYDAIRANPKIFTGFSDITSIHLAIYKKAGVMTFHGPGMTRFTSEDLTEYTRRQFFKAISTTEPLGDIELADKKKWLYSIAHGTCEGALIGGNLTLVCATLGTPYEIDTRGKILFIEEVDSEPWVIDHCLSHLRNAGKFRDLAGIVIGECNNCDPRLFDPGYYSDTDIEDVFNYYFSELGIPVLYGLPLGHTEDIATLPMGAFARMDADEKRLTVLESGVI